MSRYINADKLYDYLMQMANDEHNKGCFPSTSTVLEDIADYISVLDGADVREVVHGKWIEWLYPGDEHIYCSVCKEEFYHEDIYLGGNDLPNFCPNCGADMRGGE